jgi:hypothetical protein
MLYVIGLDQPVAGIARDFDRVERGDRHRDRRQAEGIDHRHGDGGQHAGEAGRRGCSPEIIGKIKFSPHCCLFDSGGPDRVHLGRSHERCNRDPRSRDRHGDAERDGKGEMPQVNWSNGFAIRALA